MSRHWRLMICWTALFSGTAAAQSVVTSAAPDRVAVTVYRDPNRDAATAPNLSWLNGYALITETRQVSIPAGESTIRFEGVAGGILPQSAIVVGFPEGIVERNRDAYLLSPSTLVDRSLGQRVHLRRTSMATGAVREQEAVIRSGADGALVLQTPEGFEALRCTGLRETPIFSEVPAGLSARPTLSVRTRSSRAVIATVTLSYLSSGFDWQANYIANLSADGSHVDLFAWVTLASSDETSFRNADTQAVAGRLNRERVEREERDEGALQLRCWPQRTTSDISPPAPPADFGESRRQGTARTEDLINELPQSIIVTGSRIPAPETLGDVKLYRIPEPVTVAARSQKQVALLQRAGIQIRTLYRARFFGNASPYGFPAQRLLVTRNRAEEGLGLPLPAGRLMLFDSRAGTPFLVGESVLRDHAVGEDVEIVLGVAPGVRVAQTPLARTDTAADYEIVVTNDSASPVAFEAEIASQGLRATSQTSLSNRNGMPLWQVTVPANGSATLRYRLSR